MCANLVTALEELAPLSLGCGIVNSLQNQVGFLLGRVITIGASQVKYAVDSVLEAALAEKPSRRLRDEEDGDEDESREDHDQANRNSPTGVAVHAACEVGDDGRDEGSEDVTESPSGNH